MAAQRGGWRMADEPAQPCDIAKFNIRMFGSWERKLRGDRLNLNGNALLAGAFFLETGGRVNWY
jgi:hypothetical protein